MNRSKISRSLTVIIFVATVVFLIYFDIKQIIGNEVSSTYNPLIKILYVIILLALVLFYIFFKDKLYRMKIGRKLSLTYRYIYLTIVAILTSLVFSNRNVASIPIIELMSFLFITIITSFIIKKIIFNVSKSDMLSVFAMISYTMLPNVIDNSSLHFQTMIITLFVFSAILVFQILIDELKQKGLKNKKYLILALILGIFIGITALLGVNIIIWAAFMLLVLLISFNLDNTHINFPKKVMSNISQEQREKLYSIERININKLLVCIVIVSVSSLIVYFGGRFIIGHVLQNTDNEFAVSIVHTLNESKIENIKEISFDKIIQNTITFVSISKVYICILLIYILFVEILAFALKRRYDTKSTALKILFILLYFFICITNINILLYNKLFLNMLMLIAIVNTSNIYLNREERIKMLVA